MYTWFNMEDMYVIYIYTHRWFNMEDMYMYMYMCRYIYIYFFYMTILFSWGETKPTDIT